MTHLATGCRGALDWPDTTVRRAALPESTHPDVIVAGAGPAGALCAILLARRGHEVVLLSSDRAPPRIEGLSPRVVEALRVHRLDQAAAAVGPLVERVVTWNGETSGRNREHVTQRAGFDAALRRDAAEAGVRCLPVRRLALDGAAAVRIVTEQGDALRLDGRVLVEARGRAAPCPRSRQTRGPETTALVRRLDGLGGQRFTAVEGFAEGWAWLVSGGAEAYLQIFVDSADGLPKRRELTALFDRHAAGLGLIGELMGGARPAGPVMTRGADARLADELFGARRLRVGDAAAAVDPLSGHGVFEALGSALAASAALHTLLARPGSAALARRFYLECTRHAFQRYCRVGRDFYALEQRWRERPFWRRRAAWPDDEPAHRPAFAEAPRIEARPVVEDGFVVERRVVVTPDQPRGIWRVDEVPLAELIELLGRHVGQPLDEIEPTLAGSLGATPRQLATALDWLRARRLLAAGDRVELQEPAVLS